MRNVAFLLLGLGLLLVQTSSSVVIDTHPFVPSTLLPVVLYLGVTHDIGLARGTSLAFVLGYLLDSFTGSPIGLHTFVLVATFLLARGAGISLSMRAPLFEVALSFVVAVLAEGTILALRAIFERPAPFASDDVWLVVTALTAPAATTALLAPVVFYTVRRIDGLLQSRRGEGGTSP
jgi:rod shape-determining protein MreD